jgi:hypothetical protein
LYDDLFARDPVDHVDNGLDPDDKIHVRFQLLVLMRETQRLYQAASRSTKSRRAAATVSSLLTIRGPFSTPHRRGDSGASPEFTHGARRPSKNPPN